ncbi:MAG: hypothetical protein JWO86_5785 [Myxococcaceae bacterium]|nr:hypothetical protein [Myxococcaceae bacterium]
MERFDADRAAAFESGTRKLEKFDIARARSPHPALSISTPIAEISPAMLAAARSSIVPDEAAVIIAPDPAPAAPAAPAAPDSDPNIESPRSVRNADREPGVEQLRTRLARKFTTLADVVTEGFHEFSIGAGWWVVELTAPEGMSTGGGKQVLQHLRLRPTRQGHAVLVGGVVNAVTKTAELRDHAHMDMIYRARFGRPLEITAAEWEQFLRKAEVVLRQEQIHTARVAAPRDIRMLAQRGAVLGEAAARRRMIAAIAFGISTAAAAIVVWRVIVALWP